ncbi:ParM/StbA family protein [Alteromonas antoniana]|uniref:ParM/StbA family protein n=1 Tax=Alteromonas antoniana TaxID=2803813 RepID=UPI001C46D898|nr:ParM/StbA family protein [Alteromonas antoniana]
MNIFGVDDGNYSCKLYGRVKNDVVSQITPSLVRKGLNREKSVLEGTGIKGGGDAASTFQIGEEVYSTGFVKTDSKRSQDRDYICSNENVAVVHNALHQAGMSGQEVSIMTGMPFKYFYKPSGEVNSNLVDRKKKAFKQVVEDFTTDRRPVTIAKHGIMAQGEAAYYDLLIEMDFKHSSTGIKVTGKPNPEILEATVLVLDMGGGTTDPVLIKEGGVVDHTRSGTFEHGGYKLISELEDLVKAEHGLTRDLGREKYQEALLTGELRQNASRVLDVRDLQQQVIERHFDIIMEKTIATVDGLEDVDIIVPVGGTPLFFTDVMKEKVRMCELRQVDDPINANARGAYKRLFLTLHAS